MKTFCCFLLPLLCLACGAPNSAKPSGADKAPATLEPFADSMVRLDRNALSTLNQAAGYFQRLVPADSTLADSAAVLFLQSTTRVLDTVNQVLLNDTTDYFTLVYGADGPVPPAAIRVRDSLARNHVLLQGDGEGGVYAMADYKWLLGVVQPKTSGAVDRYLQLLSDHETRPALIDAGVAVDLTEVADRLATAEGLQQQRLPKTFLEETQEMATFYTSLLLFGSDNSPAFMEGKLELTPEYLAAHQYLIRRYPSTPAAQEIKAFQAIVAAKDQKKFEEWRRRYLGGE